MTGVTPYDKFIRVYGKSEIIFEENSTGNEMYLVCSGRVKLYTERAGGRKTVLTIMETLCQRIREAAIILAQAKAKTVRR